MRSMDPEYFKRLEHFIDDYMDEYGRSPTTREIAVGTGRALSTVHKYLSQMRTEGVLDYSGHRSITTRRRKKMVDESIQVPVLGKVSCGALKLAEEYRISKMAPFNNCASRYRLSRWRNHWSAMGRL